MCGACGTGRTRGPWEDAVAGRGPRELAARARALEVLLTGLRWRVRPWGVSGFTVTRPMGAVSTAAGVDEVTAAAVRAGWDPPTRADTSTPARAVAYLSALAAAGRHRSAARRDVQASNRSTSHVVTTRSTGTAHSSARAQP